MEASGSLVHGAALVYFAKVPRAGQVKTRLCPPLTPAEAAGLYRGFLEDVLVPVVGAHGYVYGWPAEQLDELASLMPESLTLRAQRGEDLWQRMRCCFDELFEVGHDRVVLRNTDSPDLPAEVVARAIERARPGRVVLGPDPGGGYYLVALAEPCPGLFGVAAEGGTSVFDATVARARELGLEVEVLGEYGDVDRFADLLELWRRRGG